MVKDIKIDASKNPGLFRKVFSTIVGAEPLPEQFSARDDRSGKQIVEDIASEVGVSMPEASRLIGKVMQRDILTEGVNRKLRQSFNDPPNIRRDNGRLPSFTEVMERAGKFSGADERAEFARRSIEDMRLHGRSETKPERPGQSSPEHIDSLKRLSKWLEFPKRRMETPNASAWHRLRDARLEGRFDILSNLSGITEKQSVFFETEPQVLVIEHDWAGAFRGASDFQDGEYPVPYDECVFEFQIDGRRVLVPTKKDESGTPLSLICMEGDDGWWCCTEGGSLQDAPTKEGSGEAYPLYLMIYETVRALCIALDAEVVETSVTRAPHRLNIAREKKGKLPINDYHVINLARRSRVEALPSADHEPRWHPRLHFRRGHWRHFADHKTWIKWMLVGDPDLGFIDKEYRA